MELVEDVCISSNSLENLKRKDIFCARACGSLGILYMMKDSKINLAYHYLKLSLFSNLNDAKCLMNISNFILQAFNHPRLFALFYIRATSPDMSLVSQHVDSCLSTVR